MIQKTKLQLSKRFHSCQSLWHWTVCRLCTVIFFVRVLKPLFIVLEECDFLDLDSKRCLTEILAVE